MNPKAFVVAIGTNNLGAGCSAQETIKGLRAVITSLRRRRPLAKLLLLGLLPRGIKSGPSNTLDPRHNYFTKRLIAVNSALKEAAAAFGHKDVRYVDGWDLFDKEDEVNVSRMPDKLHPNAVGMLLWGQRVRGLSSLVCTPP